MNKVKLQWTIITLTFILGCNFLSSASTPTPDLFATLQASTPSSFSSPIATQPIATPIFNFSTPVPTTISTSSAQTFIPSPSSSDQPTGHIVFTCQIFKVQAINQVCIMNADGSGWRRLTTDNSRQHWYASLSPDGQSVAYSAFREANVHEIYEMALIDGNVTRLTNRRRYPRMGLRSHSHAACQARTKSRSGSWIETVKTRKTSRKYLAGIQPGRLMENRFCLHLIGMGLSSCLQST